MVAGVCSPVDWMYVTPKPAIATFFMAKNHSKPTTIGLQYQSRNNVFLTIKTVVRKTHQNNGHTGSSCLDKAVLAQRGGPPPLAQAPGKSEK